MASKSWISLFILILTLFAYTPTTAEPSTAPTTEPTTSTPTTSKPTTAEPTTSKPTISAEADADDSTLKKNKADDKGRKGNKGKGGKGKKRRVYKIETDDVELKFDLTPLTGKILTMKMGANGHGDNGPVTDEENNEDLDVGTFKLSILANKLDGSECYEHDVYENAMAVQNYENGADKCAVMGIFDDKIEPEYFSDEAGDEMLTFTFSQYDPKYCGNDIRSLTLNFVCDRDAKEVETTMEVFEGGCTNDVKIVTKYACSKDKDGKKKKKKKKKGKSNAESDIVGNVDDGMIGDDGNDDTAAEDMPLTSDDDDMSMNDGIVNDDMVNDDMDYSADDFDNDGMNDVEVGGMMDDGVISDNMENNVNDDNFGEMDDQMDGFEDETVEMPEDLDNNIDDDMDYNEDDFDDDGMNDEDPNAGDYENNDEWTPDDNNNDMKFYDEEPNDGEWTPDNNDHFYGDNGGKYYVGTDWMNLFAIFSFGWFLCGTSLLMWSCYYWRKRSNANVQWQKVDLVDEGLENENDQMIAVED